jgi:hypothetical protein
LFGAHFNLLYCNSFVGSFIQCCEDNSESPLTKLIQKLEALPKLAIELPWGVDKALLLKNLC